MSIIINSYSFGGYTARTTAFLAATGITDTTIANALNVMDLALIANGLDTKMQALYPFVGGTATTHKFNFMNPADSDAAFRLTFAGGWTHSSTGALPNGSTGYAQTYLIPASVLTVRDTHLSFYSRTNTNPAGIMAEFGCSQNAGTENPILSLWIRRSSGSAMSDQYSYASNRISTANSNSQGFYIGSRISINDHKLYKNGSQIGSTDTTNEVNNALPSATGLLLSAYTNTGVTISYSDRECALASIGAGMSSADAANFYNLVQAFETSLARQV